MTFNFLLSRQPVSTSRLPRSYGEITGWIRRGCRVDTMEQRGDDMERDELKENSGLRMQPPGRGFFPGERGRRPGGGGPRPGPHRKKGVMMKPRGPETILSNGERKSPGFRRQSQRGRGNRYEARRRMNAHAQRRRIYCDPEGELSPCKVGTQPHTRWEAKLERTAALVADYRRARKALRFC